MLWSRLADALVVLHFGFENRKIKNRINKII